MIEQTTHLLDLARLLVGEATYVQAMEVAAATSGDCDANVPYAATATLRFASAALGTVASARTLPDRHQVALQLIGEGYAMEVAERSLTDHRLRIFTATASRQECSEQDPIAAEDREFLNVLLDRQEAVRCPYAEALRSHRLACAVDRSAREDGVLIPLGRES
jgi:myo-inositol 2-dehydrogenase / D-chiro-inositol 1-dehydrogenase